MMISYEKALALISGNVTTLGSECVDLQSALRRILAEDVYADIDMPPFNKSAMDGYACRRADLDQELDVVGMLAAGDPAADPIQAGQCVKVMTGAMIPEGADTVIIVEHTTETASRCIRFTGQKTSANIAFKAEDVKTGDLVCQHGTRIQARHLAILAAVGCISPLVAVRPRVAILSTGDELVEPGEYPETGKIRNTNGPQLTAQVTEAGGLPFYMGIVPDCQDTTREAIREAMENNDLVLLSGGVSMGDFDFVPRVMQELGIEIIFQKVAVKPGRPTVFGRKEKTYIFGLPGNPVSSYINFEVMVKPLLLKMMGHHYQAVEQEVRLGSVFKRKKADRPEWVPMSYDNSNKHITPLNYHGSAHLHALGMADGLMFVPQGTYELKQGDNVLYRPL